MTVGVEPLAMAIVGLAILWATWVSKMLFDIKTVTTGLAERTSSNERRIKDLERLLPRHIPRT